MTQHLDDWADEPELTRDPTDHEYLVLYELLRRAGSATPNEIGDTLDLDAREMVQALSGLFGLALAKEVGQQHASSSDLYTIEPIELTARGRRLLFG